jgi:hypothetical protein
MNLRNRFTLATALSLLALPLSAATFTLNPVADAFVTTGPSGNLTLNNYGGAGALSIAAPGLSRGEFQSVLQFDLSAARASFDAQFGAGQWSIQSITLTLTATAPNKPIFNTSAAGLFGISWMQNDSWLEGTGSPGLPTTTGITFANLPGFLSAADEALGTFSFAGGTNGTAAYSLGHTSGFLADALAGNVVSFRLFAADSAVSYLADSRNFGTVSARPLLSIVAVPEPGALCLLATGVLLSAAARRSRGKEKVPAS